MSEEIKKIKVSELDPAQGIDNLEFFAKQGNKSVRADMQTLGLDDLKAQAEKAREAAKEAQKAADKANALADSISGQLGVTTAIVDGVYNAKSHEIAKEEIDKVKLGGRNLILNSDLNIKDRSTYLVTTLTTSVDLIEGQKYTMVIRGYVNLPQMFMVHMNGDGGTGVGFISKFGNDIETRVITFTAISPNSETSKRMLRIYNVPRASHSTNPTTIEWVALYEGEIKPPTDWSPAPEDTENKFIDLEARITALENA